MKINTTHIAKLANLPIDSKTGKKLEKQLEATIAYIERLNEVDTTNIVPTSQVTGLENITREDVITQSFTQNIALQGTKKTYNGFFSVQAILETEK